jgi:hypothetical protein
MLLEFGRMLDLLKELVLQLELQLELPLALQPECLLVLEQAFPLELEPQQRPEAFLSHQCLELEEVATQYLRQ